MCPKLKSPIMCFALVQYGNVSDPMPVIVQGNIHDWVEHPWCRSEGAPHPDQEPRQRHLL